jgi:hypothetical protein
MNRQFVITIYTRIGSITTWCASETNARALIALINLQEVERIDLHEIAGKHCKLLWEAVTR